MSAMENSCSHRGIRAKTAAWALDLFDALAHTPESLGFRELARVLDTPKRGLHELPTKLVDRAYVDHERHSRSYAPGIRVYENGHAYLHHHDLVHVARRSPAS